MVNTNKDKILDLFYNSHYKAKDIASVVGVSPSYITKIIKTDVRYDNEKKDRTAISKEKHRTSKKLYIRKKREQRKIDEAYYIVEQQHRQAVSELSKSKRLSNESYRNWNSSAYSYNDKKRRFEFKDGLGKAADVPKYIKVKI